MIEKELKFRIYNANIEKIIENLGAKKISQKRQEDIYLDSKELKLFNEGKALRLRKEDNTYYLTFKGKIHRRIPKVRKEEELKLKKRQAKKLLRILAELGYKESIRVIKIRTEYILNEIKIAIDEVENLGKFLEIEFKDEEKARELLSNLNIKMEEALTLTYPEMLKI
jgi:adenylate cyclase class 2